MPLRKAPSMWQLAYWALWLGVLLSAALNMLHIRGGFLTNHLADLTVPALLYVIFRRYPPNQRRMYMQRIFGSTPELAALVIFFGSSATEICQKFWPQGLFPGTYDPLDIAAYGAAVGFCYACDKWAANHNDLDRPTQIIG